MFTKTEGEIMKIFVSKINQRFSIKEISDSLKKPYPLIHRSAKSLLFDRFLTKDEKGLLSLNYKENHSEIAYIESLRSKAILNNDKSLFLFIKDVFEKVGMDFFIMLIFGSYVVKSNPRDIDILFVLDDQDKTFQVEKILVNIASQFSKKFDFQVISTKSAYEMLSKRDKINILNESLNKHVLLYGAENFYRMLKNAR